MAEVPLSRSIPVYAHTLQQIQEEAAEQHARQVESKEDLNQFFELSLFNPMLQAQKFRELKEQKLLEKEKAEGEEKTEEKRLLEVEKINDAASRFQRENPEMQARTLLILRARITAEDTPEDVLKKVLEVYKDPSLADEAFDFLIETSSDPSILAVVQQAKNRFRANYEREIRAGRNMGIQAREFAKEGLGSPTSLRELYRDITGNPREPLKLFEELSEQFRFTKMKSVISFLLQSLGSDLRAKGASIARAELKRLIDEIRSLQGILGVFRFFQSRMRLIYNQFSLHGMTVPPRLDFELLAKTFIRMLAERYVSPEKILQTARFLGISDEVTAQIIIYTQMRDAVRQVSPKYYRNSRHREELLKAFLDALEQLEDEEEEEEGE